MTSRIYRSMEDSKKYSNPTNSSPGLSNRIPVLWKFQASLEAW